MNSRARDLTLETLTVEQDNRVLVVRVYNPPYNFMTAQMQRDLETLTRVVDDDPSVGAVVLTGGIPKRYIPHFDISAILAAAENGRPLSPTASLSLLRGVEAAAAVLRGQRALEHSRVNGLLNITRFNDVVLRIMRSSAVYIAAIGGACGGGGLEMSVCFDVRLAADDDSVGFILPELLIGLTTTVGGQRLAQLIGPARALEMMLEGRMYSPHEAAQMGLVTRVVPAGALLDQAKDLGARYARRNRDTIAAQKKIFNENLFLSPAESLRREGAANASAIMSGPHREHCRNGSTCNERVTATLCFSQSANRGYAARWSSSTPQRMPDHQYCGDESVKSQFGRELQDRTKIGTRLSQGRIALLCPLLAMALGPFNSPSRGDGCQNCDHPYHRRTCDSRDRCSLLRNKRPAATNRCLPH